MLARLVRSIRRHRPAILHTHLVHADFHGLPAGRLARVPVLVSTKHGFNPFRDGRVFAVADRTVARLADVHVAISAGLASYLAEREGFVRRASRSSTTGSSRARASSAAGSSRGSRSSAA